MHRNLELKCKSLRTMLCSCRSYVEGYSFSQADSDLFALTQGAPDKASYPHLYRWFIHCAAIAGLRSLNFGSSSAAAAPAAAAPAAAKAAPAPKAAAAPAAKKAEAEEDDDEDLFGDDDEEEEKKDAAPKQSRAEVMAAAKAAKEKGKKIERSQ
jgi:elongation factor 1-beta